MSTTRARHSRVILVSASLLLSTVYFAMAIVAWQFQANQKEVNADILGINQIDFENKAQITNLSNLTSIQTGKTARVSLSAKNTGKSNWVKQAGFKLGSVYENESWGKTRIELDDNEVVKPGQSKIFNFEIIAPKTPGTYPFTWQMIQENKNWFGKPSSLINIVVK